MKIFTFLILLVSILSFASCKGARSDETTPEMAQNMLKLRGFNFTEPEFFRAIKLNDAVAVKGFLQGGINANAKSKEGETALTSAIQYAETPLIKLIVEKADINARDDLGNSPLHLALTKKKDDIFKLLLEKNADVNVLGRAGSKNTGQTVLYVAVAYGDEELVRQFLDRGADPNIADSMGALPLVEAVIDSEANPNIVKMMLDKGADVNKTETESGAHALIFAAQNSQIPADTRQEIVKLLLAKGADKKLKDKTGKTAFDRAKENKNTETAELLK